MKEFSPFIESNTPRDPNYWNYFTKGKFVRQVGRIFFPDPNGNLIYNLFDFPSRSIAFSKFYTKSNQILYVFFLTWYQYKHDAFYYGRCCFWIIITKIS